MSTARATVGIDDPRIRVTTWTFEQSGDSTGPHRHEYDYVVIPVTGGTFTVTNADGTTREMTQRAAAPYHGTAGTDHDVVSSSDATAVFVEVELKD
ncbi:cupin [Mycolicibacterium lacusdiani]|uniref:cupin n=1 Tax=Mycolicibacterium lacusdiani TaxID=2895283 RepID=UPI001F34956B|nr:cupin [Mycolicibacterium lacusdiani]